MEREDCVCQRSTGQCQCLPNVIGLTCDHCAPDHWNLAGGRGCEACGCDPNNSVTSSCNEVGNAYSWSHSDKHVIWCNSFIHIDRNKINRFVSCHSFSDFYLVVHWAVSVSWWLRGEDLHRLSGELLGRPSDPVQRLDIMYYVGSL